MFVSRIFAVAVSILLSFSLSSRIFSQDKSNPPAKESPAGNESENQSRRKFPSTALEFPSETAARKKIESALSQKGDFQYPDVTLTDVASDISQKFAIPVMINAKALSEIGLATDARVNLNLKGITLRSALSIILDEFELTYRFKNEILLITTIDEAESKLYTRIYDITGLIPKESERIVFRTSRPAWDVINLITSTIAPDTWTDVGGAGAIEFIDHLNVLVVSQTEVVNNQVENLLAIIKEIVDAKSPIFARQQELPKDEMMVRIYAIFRFENSNPPSVNQNTSHAPANASNPTGQTGGSGLIDPNKALEKALAERRAAAFNVEDLAKFIPSIIEPGSWSEGSGAIGVFGEHLVVRHKPQVHQKVSQLLADLDILKPRPDGMQPILPEGFGGGGGFFHVESVPK